MDAKAHTRESYVLFGAAASELSSLVTSLRERLPVEAVGDLTSPHNVYFGDVPAHRLMVHTVHLTSVSDALRALGVKHVRSGTPVTSVLVRVPVEREDELEERLRERLGVAFKSSERLPGDPECRVLHIGGFLNRDVREIVRECGAKFLDGSED